MPYAGDVSCNECWETLGQETDAQLVDVRTVPEWTFVGVPALESAGKKTACVEWQVFPTMQVNPDFVGSVENFINEAGGGKDAKIFLLCRSGARSIAAAEALTASGFTQAYNVLGGFEGDINEDGHRGQKSGWKFDNLPWVQR